ncbi:MAG: hypothetical protein IIY62_00365 [Kiritimatiellae bacterium]|nr:hypothetical protein [Kiritimatiellia bacterium]
MAIKLTATGAMVTQGRGAARAVVLDVSFAQLRAWARRMEINEGRVWRKAYGSAIRALRSKLQKVITRAGGVEGVPKFKDFEDFTKHLRTATNRTSPMGGVLAEKGRIVAYKQNGYQVIGWPDALASWAVKFQDGTGGSSADNFLADPKSRYRLHKLGIHDIPRVYEHNPRRVLPEPFGSYVRKNLDEWARNVFYKDLARQMAKESAA